MSKFSFNVQFGFIKLNFCVSAHLTPLIPDPLPSALATVEPLCTPQVCQFGGVVDTGEARAGPARGTGAQGPAREGSG